MNFAKNNLPKIYAGAMSKEIVDACINYSNQYGQPIGLIPSRRQVDYDRGYCNNWTTEEFASYVNNRCLLQRDHAGPYQGKDMDNGLVSLTDDAKYFDLIHVDIFKKQESIFNCAKLTIEYIKHCYAINPQLGFEIGTEEGIFPYSVANADIFLDLVREGLTSDEFSRVIYGVIQGGTKLLEDKNSGVYDKNKAEDMISLMSVYGLLPKEHNADYQDINIIKEKFSMGLAAINLAPEFSMIQNLVALNCLKSNPLAYEVAFSLCLNSKTWVKWVGADFDPNAEKDKLMSICLHYLYSNLRMRELLLPYQPEITAETTRRIFDKLNTFFD